MLNKSFTDGGTRQEVEGRLSDPILEWRLVGRDPTDKQAAGDRWTLEEGGFPLAPIDPVTPLPLPMVIPLSDARRPAKDWATRR